MRIRIALGAALLATLAACGGTDNARKGGSNGNGPSVSVVEPVSGASVSMPFTVKLNSSEPLGPTESGKHHVHIWFDDNDSQYLVVESDKIEISPASSFLSGGTVNLPAGQHTMHVSLRNANHSAAGAEATTPITVGSGGAPAPAPTSTGTSANPYGY